MFERLLPVILVVGALTAVLVVFLIVMVRCYRQVEQGKVLIINPMRGEPQVTFTGGTVFPIINKSEVMDISVKSVEIDRRGKDGLICQDNIRADINVNFFIRVNKTVEDVLKVAQSIGVQRASDQRAVQAFFQAKFSEALKTVGKHFDFEQLYNQRDAFKDRIIEVIGKDLNGYILDDAAIDYLEQTPLAQLDKDNILDADGIRKITERTTAHNVKTNELRRNEEMELEAKNLIAKEAVLRFEQQRAAAEAKTQREIAVSTAREVNEAARVTNEEEKLTHITRQKNEEEVRIAVENKERAVGTAAANREADIALVARTRATQVSREVELQEIAKEQDIAIKKKEIAVVLRERINVEKSVAQEEENIKTLRTSAEAQRHKEVKKIEAEAVAEAALVQDVRKAEAAEEVAKREARRRLVLADADFEAADKTAKAKVRVAEGVAAEEAAAGMALVRVKEAEAAAIEKVGLAEARVALEKMQTAAVGEERQGKARIAVREAEAEAITKQGMAEVGVERQRAEAVALAEEQRGMALVKVREAEAEVVRKRGEAEAEAKRLGMLAEAAGLREKAEAMHALDEASRVHEEFRLRLEMDKAVALESIHAKRELASAQAQVMKEAFSHAKINIVGGDGAFFDKFVKALSVGASFDGMIEHSEQAQHLLRDYLQGDKSLPADLKEVLVSRGLSSEGLKNLSLSAVLAQLASGKDDGVKRKLLALGQKARELGIDNLGEG